MVQVTLTNQELWMATSLGIMRGWQSKVLKSKDKVSDHSYTESIRMHILGALGEAAFAKYFQVYNSQTFNEWKNSPDIKNGEHDIEIRTRSKESYDLIIREDDKSTSIYVLATGDGDQIKLHGWIYGDKGKKKEYIKEYGGKSPAYFIPSNKLNSIESLVTIVSNKYLMRGKNGERTK